MNKKRLFLASLVAAPMMLSLTACSGGEKGITIRVLNLDDYIYVHNPKDGYDEPNLTEQFEKYCEDELGIPNVHVIYEVSDTNESEYNDLLTGRIKYDLVCTSDYMLQKFAREDLITPLPTDIYELENYNKYASKEIKGRLDQIPVTLQDGTTAHLQDYAVGYMWGTLGILINPEYNKFVKRGYSLEEIAEDTQSWDVLWNDKYSGSASIKNSMRDTYAVALMHGYDDVLCDLKDQNNAGEITDEEYQERISTIFNLTDEEVTLPMVKEELNSLKGNIFGMEVDSGKQDIITGKIGYNLAWSGDAVYSMDEAENPVKLREDQLQELYYSVPENGSNLWLDAWCMPKNDQRDEETAYIAMAFLDYLCSPDTAYMNMEYTGYTSFIAGDSIVDLVTDWYDVRTYLVTYEDVVYNKELKKKEIVYYDVYYIDPITGEETQSEFEDCHFEENNDPEYDEVELYYYDLDDNKVFVMEEDEEGNEYTATYNSYFLLDDYEVVDLSYFFKGTLEKYSLDDVSFYSDCYLPFEDNISVGRQFFCQYPNEETIKRCSVMADYGEDNIKIVKLWEDFKSNPLPTWAIVLLVVEIIAGLGLLGYFIYTKHIKKRMRLARKGLNK